MATLVATQDRAAKAWVDGLRRRRRSAAAAAPAAIEPALYEPASAGSTRSRTSTGEIAAELQAEVVEARAAAQERLSDDASP